MRLSLAWLRDWVEVPHDWDARELARRLTLSGFEVEGINPAAPPCSGVVVAKIVSIEPHPQADKLRVCRVSTAEAAQTLTIVCGAANARAGLVSALATVGAQLPFDKKIALARMRGVESQGMLCSAKELALAEASDGILELPDEAPLGMDLRTYLDLDDQILEINVTPNRGDAMSVLGLAREVAALSGQHLKSPARIAAGQALLAGGEGEPISVQLRPGAGAARLLARALRDVDNTRASPLWLRERLRRAGLRSISLVVDVTNFVMLELGQPMHAFDMTKLRGGLKARPAGAGEGVRLLDGREVELEPDVLVIADDSAIIGIAGIMGGEHTAITRDTRDVALEVAFFKPEAIAGRARRYGLQTDASQRFERGVDWRGQERALGLATHLIVTLTGGTAGPVTSAQLPDELPRAQPVRLRERRLTQLTGEAVPAPTVEQRLKGLGLEVTGEPEGWRVLAPSWRFDIGIEADLIEEVVRIGGLDAIAESDAELQIAPRSVRSDLIDPRLVLRSLAARGYQEIVTFGFVDPALQRTLFGERPMIELANPIAADLAVMRSSLWPGLISVARENLRRQQPRVRLTELATRFLLEDGKVREQQVLSGIALGTRLPEQWGSPAVPVDFFDLKADLHAVLSLASLAGEITYEAGGLACLHPGRSARLMHQGRELGVIGELHPSLTRTLELTYAPILFEIDYVSAFHANPAQFREVSRFPQIRRDLSITLPENVSYARLRERVSVAAGSLLKKLSAFDVYQGKGVESGRKSVALGLILQDLNRTLTDEDADRVVKTVLDDLQSNLDARIRE